MTGWTQVARLVAPQPGFNDHFGGSVAIEGDTIVIGATGERRARRRRQPDDEAAQDFRADRDRRLDADPAT